MTRGNPRTRGARFPFVIQGKHDHGKHKGKWYAIKGANTYEEALMHVMGQVGVDRREKRASEYRIRSNRKTVYLMKLSLPYVVVNITTGDT